MTTTASASRPTFVRAPRQTSRSRVARTILEPLDLRTPSGRHCLPY